MLYSSGMTTQVRATVTIALLAPLVIAYWAWQLF